MGGTLEEVEDTPESRRQIGARIGQARISAGYENAAEFARQVGVQPNTIYRYESGRIVPDIFTLERLARVARVSMEFILRGPREDHGRSPVLDRWLATPRGSTVRPDAVAFLERLPLNGYTPTPAFYDLALLAYEQGLSPEDASLSARFTESKKER